MKVTMINASSQFANISQMQPFQNRRNKKYKTSMNKTNKNGKTTLIKPKNFLNFNNEEN
jgi:peptidyl-tRNA hydrolase